MTIAKLRELLEAIDAHTPFENINTTPEICHCGTCFRRRALSAPALARLVLTLSEQLSLCHEEGCDQGCPDRDAALHCKAVAALAAVEELEL